MAQYLQGQIRSLVILLLLVSCSSPQDNPTASLLSPEIDSSPPQAVTDAVLLHGANGEVELHWTAPFDDDRDEPVTSYEIRYSDFVIDLDDFRGRASAAFEIDATAAPGEREFVVLPDVERGERMQASIRALDENGNASSRGNIAALVVNGTVTSGRCFNVYDRTPVEGLRVSIETVQIETVQSDTGLNETKNGIQTGVRYETVTDHLGMYRVVDVPLGSVIHVTIYSGDANQAYHRVSFTCDSSNDFHSDIVMIPREINMMASSGYRNVLHTLEHLYATGPIAPGHTLYSPATKVLYKWLERPLPVYVPARTRDGVDLQAAVIDALQSWNHAADEDVFKFVTEPPDIGIRVEWETSTTADYRLQEFMPDGLHPKSARIRISSTRYPTYQGIRTVMMHEFGHAHRWGHAINSRYLLTGGATSNTVSDPTDDERRAFLLMLALPDRIDLSRYHIDDF